MVAAYHLIWTAYGWWLPNDPRGSMSKEVHAANIAGLGELHYGRKKILPAYRDIQKFYAHASEVLKFPLLTFSEPEIGVLGERFAAVVKERRYTCYACAIMPDHVHVLIRKHRDQAEEMIQAFQEAGRAAVVAKPQAGRNADHPVWGGPGWKVYLNTSDDIKRVIEYIWQNPIKARRPPQSWPFIVPYDGWLPGLAAGRAPKGSRPH
jgi:REP element-mobilizing transposase RayT